MWGLLSYGNPSCGDPILCISILCGHSNPKPPACGGSHPACGNSQSCIWNLLLIAFLHVELLRMTFLRVELLNPACGDFCIWHSCMWGSCIWQSCMWGLLLLAFLHMGFPACGTPAYGNPACGIAACGIPACGASQQGFSSPDDFSVQSEYNLNKKSIVLEPLDFL